MTMQSNSSFVARLGSCLAAGLLASFATAQTPISGALSGSLVPGVYHASTITVATLVRGLTRP